MSKHMLASGYGVDSAPLLSLVPAPRRVSCASLREPPETPSPKLIRIFDRCPQQ